MAPTLSDRIAEIEAEHYRWQPSDWGDFDTEPTGCVPDGVMSGNCPMQALAEELKS